MIRLWRRGKIFFRLSGVIPYFAVIDYYLSPAHRDNTEFGCIIPTLSGEIPQLSQEVRHVFTLQLQRIIDFITQLANVNKSTASALFSLIIGTIVLARSVSDSNMSDNILTSGRQHAKDVLHSLNMGGKS